MTTSNLAPAPVATSLDIRNTALAALDARGRIEWALSELPGRHVLTSSFGAQAAVALHLVTQAYPDIPVILVDTGYLFPETYRYIDELAVRLRLNLHVYRASLTPAWQEARYGKRWSQGIHGLAAYNAENKVEPLRRALTELEAGTWFAGLRRSQSRSRAGVAYLESRGTYFKVHPIVDWSDDDVQRYLEQHRLPAHPLWSAGYVSIGDTHSTRPVHEVRDSEHTRFFGLKRECGIHEIDGR